MTDLRFLCRGHSTAVPRMARIEGSQTCVLLNSRLQCNEEKEEGNTSIQGREEMCTRQIKSKRPEVNRSVRMISTPAVLENDLTGTNLNLVPFATSLLLRV